MIRAKYSSGKQVLNHRRRAASAINFCDDEYEQTHSDTTLIKLNPPDAARLELL